MRGRLAAIAIIVALAATLVAAETAGACVCAFGVTPKQKLKAADGAVTARLLSVHRSEDNSETALRYRIGRVFKGGRRLHRRQLLTIRDELSATDCAMPTTTGAVYGLLLTRRAGRWTSGFCSMLPPKTLRRAARHAAGSSASSGSGCSA